MKIICHSLLSVYSSGELNFISMELILDKTEFSHK